MQFANRLINRSMLFLLGKRGAPEFAQIAVLIMVVGLLAAAVFRLVPIISGLLDSGASMLGG